MSWLRFLMLLALVVWLGGLIFFPVLAGEVFAVVPDRALAGSVVGRCLALLHAMAMVAGAVFLIASLASNHAAGGRFRPAAPAHLLVVVMLALTLVSQFGIIPRMDRLRSLAGGEMAAMPRENPIRLQFDNLHRWSTRLEGGILVLGLAVLYLTARTPPGPLKPSPPKEGS